ncbi:hypothetical protein P3T37_002752 [Kitasatospora sp. MAA4]|uniref:hypothetical protein n=1 Tax=Kitasatospora sp. MAA4 TaxID=3035093 RepID=UPI0024761B4A|nr:hypothetical protein [Kitasatospora sp. MAA4]MDH6133357.1 hypothetical protein [Kitasatospora sp. MAA4]
MVNRERRPRRVGIGCGVLVGGFAVFMGALFWADERMLQAGCGSVDATDPMNYSAVAIRNDSTAPVVVDQCVGGYCDPVTTSVTLQPGDQVPVHAGCGVSGAAMTSWRVTTGTGGPLGYIAVDTPRSTNGLVFPVSAAQPSRSSPATPVGVPGP